MSTKKQALVAAAIVVASLLAVILLNVCGPGDPEYKCEDTPFSGKGYQCE